MKSAAVLIAALLVCASAAPAFAQRGGGGGGHRGGGGGAASSASNAEFAPLPPNTPAAQVEMVGVVQEIDVPAQRITIAYEAAPLLNLSAWTMPFPVARPELLNGVAAGQKVRFKVDSHQIYILQPF